MDALDLDRPELREVADAWRAGRGRVAINALLHHFEARRLDPRLLWEPAANAEDHKKRSDAALEGCFELQDASARPPRRPDGGLDWQHRGPRSDPEWPRFLNRHDFIRSLLRTWRASGDERYRHAINDLLVDWLDHMPVPRGRSLNPAWRSLEAARRATLPWLEVFFALEPEPVLHPGPRLRMLLGILDHGRVLRTRHARLGNHHFTEVVALAVLGTAWPELRAAAEWRGYAVARATRALFRQTYPDGAHVELSNHYHRVVVMEAERLLAVLSRYGGEEERAQVAERVRAMWDYFAGVTLPDGSGPLNNDGDREPNARYLREAGLRHDNPQWLHVASGGLRGAAPPSPPSRFFPWAGQALMRDGWGPGAQWARFDMGPHGTAHQHADQLSLEVSLGGRQILVDPGRYTYRPGPARDYMKGPGGHNVVQIDGEGSIAPPWRARAASRSPALRTPALDFFSHSARFPADPLRGRGGARWTRAVVYLRERFWIVLDRFEVCGPSEVAASWLFHPACRVEMRDGAAYTCDPGAPNLALLPLGEVEWRIETYRGVREPEWRGWYSERYNVIAACTQLEFRASLRAPTIAGWLLYPLAPDAPGAPDAAGAAGAAGAPPRVSSVKLDEVRPGTVRAAIDADGERVVLAALDGSSVSDLVPGLDGDVSCALIEIEPHRTSKTHESKRPGIRSA